MWTKDRKVLNAYRECMKNVMKQLEEREEVDFESMCESEMTKMMGHTNLMLDEWVDKNPIMCSDEEANHYTPKLPYFQQFWKRLKDLA